MGILRKFAESATGVGKLNATADSLARRLAELAARQTGNVTVSFTQEDIGVVNSLDTATTFLTKRLERAGHRVVDVIVPNGGWDYIVHLVVRPSGR